MKTTVIFLFFLVFSNTLLAQCPSAGQDSAVIYCKNEFFDVAELRSSDADTNGVFSDPAGDTLSNTVISLAIPGVYTYSYHVTDTGCPVDTAKYVITITNGCWFGLPENALENTTWIKTNPINEQLVLNDFPHDVLEIYETSGRMVLSFSKEKSILDVSSLQSGNYLLVHEKNGIRQFQRFLKY